MQKNTKKIRRIVRSIPALAIIFIICTGAIYDSAGIDVTVTEINEFTETQTQNTFRTRHENVNSLLDEFNISVGLYDKMNMTEENTVVNGDEIIIRKGVGISVTADGTLTAMSTTNAVVADALVENGYFLDEYDYTVPALDAPVTENMNITVVRVEPVTETRDETVPFETVYKNDSTLYEGEQQTSVKGVNGVIRITEDVVYENGAEVSRAESSRETVTEKVDEVILKGTKKKEAPKKEVKKEAKKEVKKETSKTSGKSENTSAKSTGTSGGTTPSGLNYSKKMSMTATAYSAFKKGGGYGTTASGRTAKYGVVAVDPKVIPLGTNLYVEGYGYAIAADTGGAIKGNKIDLCFEKPNSELMAFGRQTVTVYILD